MKNDTKCYCLEIFRKQFGEHIQGNCLKMDCARYRRERRVEREKDTENK